MIKKCFSIIFLLYSILGFSQDGSLDATFGAVPTTPGFQFKRIMSYGETNNGIGNTIAVSPSNSIIIGSTEEKRSSFSSPLEYCFGFHMGEAISNDNFSGVGIEECNSSTILTNGKSVLIGSVEGSSIFNVKDIQMQFNNANGTLDSSVSLIGRRTINIGYSESIFSIKEYNNKLYACGYLRETSSSNIYNILILRFDLSGNLDSTFGTNGYVKQYINGYPAASDIFIQQDSKILVVAPSESGLGVKVIRYLNNGSQDNSFGTNGVASFTNTSGTYGNKVIVQNDNKILISGTLQINSPLSLKYSIMRLNENGSIDTSFATNGIYNTVVGAGVGGSCSDMKLLSNGKIILAGNLTNNTGIGILRLSSNGVLDATFGINGITSTVVTNFGYTNIKANSIAIRPNNNILVVGGAKSNSTLKNEIFIAQYNNSSVLSTKDITNNNITFYPNPVNENIFIENNQNSDYEIYDINGKKILNGYDNQINVSSLEKGIYILKLIKDDKVSTKKFIKE